MLAEAWIKDMNFLVSSPKELSRRDLAARNETGFWMAKEPGSFALGSGLAIHLGSKVSLIAWNI